MILQKCSCNTIIQCRKNSIITIKNNNYCLNHSLLLLNKYVITIQKIYRGYKARKYIVNIFNKLPNELQK